MICTAASPTATHAWHPRNTRRGRALPLDISLYIFPERPQKNNAVPFGRVAAGALATWPPPLLLPALLPALCEPSPGCCLCVPNAVREYRSSLGWTMSLLLASRAGSVGAPTLTVSYSDSCPWKLPPAGKCPCAAQQQQRGHRPHCPFAVHRTPGGVGRRQRPHRSHIKPAWRGTACRKPARQLLPATSLPSDLRGRIALILMFSWRGRGRGQHGALRVPCPQSFRAAWTPC